MIESRGNTIAARAWSMLALCALLVLPRLSSAANEVLGVERGPAGWRAVITGTVDNECAIYVPEPSSITRAGSHFEILSPFPPVPPCFIPIDPPRVYRTGADLGSLAPGTYSIRWAMPFGFERTLVFQVTDAPPQVVPSTSIVGLVALVLAMLVVGWAKGPRG